MASLLRHGAGRRLVGSMVQRAQSAVAEERGCQLVSRLMHTKERAPGEIRREVLEDLSDQANPRPGDRFSWRQVPFSRYTKSVASVCNFVITASLFGTVLSTCDVGWLLGKEKHPEVMEGS